LGVIPYSDPRPDSDPMTVFAEAAAKNGEKKWAADRTKKTGWNVTGITRANLDVRLNIGGCGRCKCSIPAGPN